MKTRLGRKPLAARRQRRRIYTTRDSNRWVFDQSVRVGPVSQFKGYNGEIPTIGEVSTMKISSDKRVQESSSSFYSYRAVVNFQIAVALTCLHRDEFDMHQFMHMESIAWAQSISWIKVHLSMYAS